MSHVRLGKVQLKIMHVLWERGRVSAREITDGLNRDEPIAHSTVQTLLRKLEAKGAVGHETLERTFVFFRASRRTTFAAARRTTWSSGFSAAPPPSSCRICSSTSTSQSRSWTRFAASSTNSRKNRRGASDEFHTPACQRRLNGSSS